MPVIRGLEAVVAAFPPKTGAIPVTVECPDGEDVELCILPMARYKDEDRFMPPFWCVDKRDGDDINMEIDHVDLDSILSILSPDQKKGEARPARNDTVKVALPGICFPVRHGHALPAPAPRPARKRRPGESRRGPGKSLPEKMRYPVMTNTRALSKGTELVCAKAKPVKPAAKPKAKPQTAWSIAAKEMKQNMSRSPKK